MKDADTLIASGQYKYACFRQYVQIGIEVPLSKGLKLVQSTGRKLEETLQQHLKTNILTVTYPSVEAIKDPQIECIELRTDFVEHISMEYHQFQICLFIFLKPQPVLT